MTTVSVIIPALNQAENIQRLVRDVRAQDLRAQDLPAVELSVVVVDNGSNDATAQEARSAGALVVQEPRQGYGYACAVGVAAATDAQILVFMDADYSSLPDGLSMVLNPLLSGQADLCLGSRELGGIQPGAMLPHQRFGNRLASWLMRARYRLPVTDLGPYRAIRRDVLLSLEMHEMTFG